MSEMKVYAGVDIGSTTSKCVLMDENEELVAFTLIDTLYDRNVSGELVLEAALEKVGLERKDIYSICSTGYGRDAFKATDAVMPEIICHGYGTRKMCPGTRTIIDIGGQDSKIILLDKDGIVNKFEMNDKCAAGTGRFFEVLSQRLLNVSIDELGPIAMRSEDPCMLSAICTVFAESEIVSYLSQGRSVSDVAMGILQAIARRIYAMAAQSRMDMKQLIVLTGGLAKNIALKKVFEEKFGLEMTCLESPQMPAAYGAALIAKQRS